MDLLSQFASKQIAVISFYVQCFFCYRLYALSKMWWIAAPIKVLYVLGLTSAIVAVFGTFVMLKLGVADTTQ